MTYSYYNTDGFYDIESLHDAWTLSRYNPAGNILSIFVYWGERKLKKLSQDDIELIKSEIFKINPELIENGTSINVFNGIEELAHFAVPLFGQKIKTRSNVRQLLERMPGHTWGGSLVSDPFEGKFKDQIKKEDGTSDPDEKHSFQFGFNSKAYDMPMLAYAFSEWTRGVLPNESDDWGSNKYILPSQLKDISDKIIMANYPGSLTEFDFDSDAGKILNAMTKSKRFCDIRLLLGKSAKLTLGLKRYAAQAGWKILESDLVKGNFSLHQIAKEEGLAPITLLADVLAYNVLDVLNTKRLFEEKDWQLGMSQHQQMLDRFKDRFEGRLYVDSTNSKFIEYVIVPNNGGKPVRLTDSPAINLTYPTADGKKDLLEIAREVGADEEVIAFYDNFRGARTNPATGVKGVEAGQAKVLTDPRLTKAREEGRLTEKGTSLDVWVTDAKKNPNNSHINVSIGGAHGEFADHDLFAKNQLLQQNFLNEQKLAIEAYKKLQCTDASLTDAERNKETAKLRMQFARIAKDGGSVNDVLKTKLPETKWLLKDLITVNSKSIKNKRAPKFSVVPKDYVNTIIGKTVVHIDVDSLYPTLLSLLGTFMQNGRDVFNELRLERLKLKRALPEHHADFTEKDKANNAVQLLNKLLLNSATGAADANFDTNILVSNKITSMRIIGNLLIYILSIWLANAGGTLVSINTDGLYVTGLTVDEVQPIADRWQQYFQLSAGPEIIDRFVSKDTNNRLEVSNNKIDYAGGSSFSAWKKPSLMKSVAKPAMMDEALVNYLAFSKTDPLDKFDSEAVREYIQSRIDNAKTKKEKEALLLQFQWIFTGSASKNRHYFAYDPLTDTYEKMANISRTFITNPEYSNKKVCLMSSAKGNKTDDPIAHQLIKDHDIHPVLEAGQHLETAEELAVDRLMAKISALRKSKDDLFEFYTDHQEELNNAAIIMGVNMSTYSPLALINDFKAFVSFYTNAYKNSMVGKNSKILRTSFIASPRVNKDMSFIVDNHGLDYLSETDLLENIDVDAYVRLIEGEWKLWAENHLNVA